MCDFDRLGDEPFHIVTDGDLEPATVRGHFVQLSPHLHQIKRGRGRRGLPPGDLYFPVGRLRNL